MTQASVLPGESLLSPAAAAWHPRAALFAVRGFAPFASRPDWDEREWVHPVKEPPWTTWSGLRFGAGYEIDPDPDGGKAGTFPIYGAAVSLTFLLLIAAAAGVWRVARAVRALGRGEPPPADGPPDAARRLARPWVAWLALVGGLASASGAWPDPAARATWWCEIVRGPADVPHPRAIWLGAERPTARPPAQGPPPPPPPFPVRLAVPAHEPAAEFARPGWGVWGGVRPASPFGPFPRTTYAVVLSLWWFAAACLLANAATLWRARGRRRGRGLARSAGTTAGSDDGTAG